MRGGPKPTATTAKGPATKPPTTQINKAHDSKHLPREFKYPPNLFQRSIFEKTSSMFIPFGPERRL